MKKAQPTVMLVADDNGYADHKLAFFTADGKIECLKVATSVQVGGSNMTSVDGNRQNIYQVVDAENNVVNTYTCSAAVTQPLNLRNANYPFVEPNRVLLHHVMVKAGLAGKNVKVGLTLPFGDFFNADGSQNVPFIKRAVENFEQNNVVTEKDALKVAIASAHMFPEALSAFYDWGLDETGGVLPRYEALEESDGSILIVDIGGSTTDIVCIRMVDGSLMIDHAHSGTERIGVLDVKEQINTEYQKKYGSGGHESHLSTRAVTKILETSKHRGGGRELDLSADVQAIIGQVSQRVVNYVESKAGKIGDYQAIHFVGGGAVVFKDALQKAVSFATIGDEFANARGVLKYMVEQQEAN
ncbi:ParM/StbA family protein [Pseudomonas veronii]|uniref:ParM/StbA family protein n=1 Tax=Pseudomonas veronii TaxID=76761 RepID=UPI0015A2B460|nr:ParM/StbA family protein [Pseudomonas veronii]NWD57214.1 ParM/StbA family protein [Pseudomonas veronii]